MIINYDLYYAICINTVHIIQDLDVTARLSQRLNLTRCHRVTSTYCRCCNNKHAIFLFLNRVLFERGLEGCNSMKAGKQHLASPYSCLWGSGRGGSGRDRAAL